MGQSFAYAAVFTVKEKSCVA
ncbi:MULTISPECIES: membrane protein YoeI [Lelliottia]